MQITKTSTYSGITRTMDIPCTEEQYLRWLDGELIQNAMPNLSEDHREFLMTGVTPEEWDEMFGEPDEDEDDYYPWDDDEVSGLTSGCAEEPF